MRAIFFTFSSVFNKVFKRVFVPKFFIFICFQSFRKSKKIKSLEILFCFSFYISIKKFFPSIFFVVLFSNLLISHILEPINSNPIFRIFVLWEALFVISLRSPREYLWTLWSPSVFLSLLCAWLGAHLLCRGLCLRERSCVLPVLSCNSSVEVPLWKVLCGHSGILMCEGEDVEQWLEPQNIIFCLRLIHYLSTLSLFIFYIALHCSYYIHGRYCLFVPTLVLNQESL